MKILMVVDQYYEANNGMTISARRFAEVLRSHGHEVKILCGVKKKGNIPEEALANTFALKKFHFPFFDWLISSQGMMFAKPKRKVIKEAIEWADVVHFLNAFHLERITMRMCRKREIPFTTAFHVQPENITSTIHLERYNWINNIFFSYWRRHFYQYSKHIHCPSQFIADQLVEHGYKSQIHVISNGIDPDFKYRKIPKEPKYADKFLILMIGRMSVEKKQEVFLEGVMKSKYRDNIQVILAGKGPTYKKIRRLGDKMPNPAVIDFYTKNQLIDVISMCDLYVHSAHVEIEAMSCMEAFAGGLVPIIADSKKSATKQFALDDRSLFEDGNTDQLAQKIDYWYEHPEEKQKMEHEYAESAKKYLLDSCVRQCEEMFESAIKDN